MKKVITIMTILLLTISMSFAASSGSVAIDSKNVAELNITAKGASNTDELNKSNMDEPTSTQQNQQNQIEVQELQNQSQIQNKMMQSGEFSIEDGKQMKVQAQDNNRMRLQVGNASAQTGFQLMQQVNNNGEMQINVQLSNGKNAQIRVMPDAASQKALERLQIKNCNATNECQIELKEVGEGNQTRAAYEVQAQKQAKFLGLFKTRMNVTAQVDAESGEVIRSKKPWWAFLASESEE